MKVMGTFLAKQCDSIRLYADYSTGLAKVGADVVLAGDFSDKIRNFLRLAEKLTLSRAEELTLLMLPAADWQKWRSLTVAPRTEVPPQLERRMDYALALLTRMAASEDSGEKPADPALRRR
jgi:hypothetical protein